MHQKNAGIVMVVDDDPSVLQSVSALLSSQGFNTHSFSDGYSAFNAYNDVCPEVVVSDVSMPGMSGLKFFEKIRSIDTTTPVILLTGVVDLEIALAAKELKVFGFLSKPVESGVIVEAVTQGVNLKRTIRFREKPE